MEDRSVTLNSSEVDDLTRIIELGAATRETRGTPPPISIEVYQQDWGPGYACFLDDGSVRTDAKAHVGLNLGNFLGSIEIGELDSKDLPYAIAESLMHEVVHVLESWANVEFNEERVEGLLTAYREKYHPHAPRYEKCEPRETPEQQAFAAAERVSQPVAPPPPSVIHSNPCPKCGRTEIHKLCSELQPAAEPVAPGESALAQSCEIISDLVEKLDFEGITESESDSIVRAKEFVRAAAPAGTQPAQEGK
jgi:hypothetical protein